ncbi:MAG: hypothetical protein JSS72_06060 [Armatimonadetes bacterium]|nr:hypothetical protein [Armatimonadota bacterium]
MKSAGWVAICVAGAFSWFSLALTFIGMGFTSEPRYGKGMSDFAIQFFLWSSWFLYGFWGVVVANCLQARVPFEPTDDKDMPKRSLPDQLMRASGWTALMVLCDFAATLGSRSFRFLVPDPVLLAINRGLSIALPLLVIAAVLLAASAGLMRLALFLWTVFILRPERSGEGLERGSAAKTLIHHLKGVLRKRPFWILLGLNILLTYLMFTLDLGLVNWRIEPEYRPSEATILWHISPLFALSAIVLLISTILLCAAEELGEKLMNQPPPVITQPPQI